MMLILSLLISMTTIASAPRHWNSALEIVDRHEFYLDGEAIVKPKDAWQVLFSVVYPDGQLNLQKDCVLFRVPGATTGELKIKKTDKNHDCEDFLFIPGDQTWVGIKALDFSTKNKIIVLNQTLEKYQSETWKVSLHDEVERPKPTMYMSSADYKAPKIILLAASDKLDLTTPAQGMLKNGQICHEVSDDCHLSKTSQCQNCPEGWYEVPTGCPIGPKYCGIQQCGKKNQPACRRGIKYQRDSEKKYECRGDNSFAYCSAGLKIQCEGAQAFCR